MFFQSQASLAGTVTAGLYAPADTTDEKQSKQLSELRRYASARSWEVLEFRERHARAGTRPVFSQMMRRSRTPRFNLVLVGSLDCFARSLAELHASLSGLQGLGIRFLALHENVDVDPKTGAGKSFFDN